MASITQLFDDLCEALLPAVQPRPGQRSVDRRRAKQGLKRVAYNALFTNLFLEDARPLRPDLSKLPVRNKVLMLSFDLRVGGLGPEADRLEELVEGLEAASCCPLLEVGSVLKLLVQLAGSGPPQILRRKRDYFFNNKHAGRNVPYSGYDCCGLSGSEMDVQSLISREEYLSHSMIQETLQVMEAAPGTGLPTVGLFSFGDPCGDRFERDTRVSLFGAFVHSRTYDMDVRLDFPPVPDSADLSGLAIKVPQSMDQWEDEGFQSASNLTPDSQSEPSVTPDVDLWEAALTYEVSKQRCWERIGCPPGHREEPYLTEAGRDAFDRFCRLRQEELQVLSGGLLQAPRPVLVTEQELVKDSLNVLLGVASATFSLCQPAQAFVVAQGVHVSGASPESISSILSEVAAYGTCYVRLSCFSLQPALGSCCGRGLVFQAFTSGLRRYLQYYGACVLATPPTLSLLTIGFLFKKLGRQLRYLAELCGVGAILPGAGGGEPRASFPTGVRLLSYLYQEALDNCSNEHYPVLLSLLKTSCEPYTRFIHDWVYSGVFRDVYGEFMIQVNDEYLGCRDKSYWTHGYVLISKDVEDCVPVFLRHVAHDVYVCGKTINLLKLCCPQHYLCWSDIPVPRISVIFSLEELKEVEKDCAVYVGRMERVAHHSSISKEEKELRMEIAKQELIAHAREAASRVLRELSDRQTSEQMALDARKREQFQQLKEQFVKDQERRLVARQEELDEDFSYARELRDRERRLQALEEELEKKASSRPRWNIHGHVSDASIRVGENVSDVAASRPRWNIHGHVSDASIRVGENVSDVAASRLRWNTHGHVSDASIRVGENVSDVAASRPRWNLHGHVSDASIRVGENVSDVAVSRPRWNIHGHVSDSSIQIGASVSDVASSQPCWDGCTTQPLFLEAESNLPRLPYSLLGQGSQLGSPEVESPALECVPTLSAEVEPATCFPGAGSWEAGGLRASPSAVAEPGTLGDSVSEQPAPERNGNTVDLSPHQPPDSQGDTATPGQPGPGEEAVEAEAEAQARRWGEEQAYLASLARLYPLEQYPDSYEAMLESPVTHLVHHVLPRAFTFPMDLRAQPAVDETAVQLSELLTLPVLMKRSLTAPLAAHVSLVNKAAVDYFFVELHLESHFEALRHFLLMEDGEFAQSLSDLLFEKLAAGQSPGELLSPLALNCVLNKALQCSLHGDSPRAAGLSFALKHLPEVFAPNTPDVLSCLELRYKVDWPLNIVITESCLSKYSAIFSFLLQLKLMMWTLKDICFHLKRTALVSHSAGSVQFRQLQLFKHEMQHFVKVTQGYIANQILHVSWCEFRARLATVSDLEEIQRAHAEYLHKAVFRGLLTEKAAPVMNIIHSIFSLVLKFRSQLISQAWGPASSPQGTEHPNFALMQQSYSTFKYYSHFLFKVVTKLVNRGYQPHLEDFLLRINFNNYYQDA
ncbi:PREDICTED: gamma-tubulin complex component 6 [Chinchilla lanigera]|uniref:gamma-tubulin complex component 6 n=1 Tax=Chinchilla lanigera TaxID=34839 RepID=UPI00038EAFC7|nr:PREDICTED: gamma-tubulin complex component 6 [Chinchilla lanigera]